MIQIGATWADLMKAIIEYVKLSPEEIEAATGVSYMTIYNVLNGKTELPSFRTVRRLEEGLGIIIDKRGMTFRTAETEEEINSLIPGAIPSDNEIKIVRNILNKNYLLNPENITGTITMDREVSKYSAVAYRVDNETMGKTICQNDTIVFDTERKISENDVVILLTKVHNVHIARLKVIADKNILLYGENGTPPLIISEKDVECMYKVIRVIKEL